MEDKLIRPNIVQWSVAQLTPDVREHFPDIIDQELYAPYVVFTVRTGDDTSPDIVFILNGEDLYRITTAYLQALAIVSSSTGADQILQ